MTGKDNIRYLLEQCLAGTLSPAQQSEWTALLADPAQDESLCEAMHQLLLESDNPLSADRPQWEARITAILGLDKQKPLPKITRWWWAAALIVFLAGAGYLFNRDISPAPGARPYLVKNDLPPGGNKATLTLSNGQQIILDSVANGTLAHQGSVIISKSANGKIDYQGTDAAIVFNTLSTPRGGQYQLQLPDGSNVWLDAASSITYPIAFTGDQRTVTITGEAYFEVARDKSKPFHVRVGDMTIDVLGTAFNINAYIGEPVSKMTLVEGSIKISPAGRPSSLLKPGQQGQLMGQQFRIVDDIDVDQTVAWKNGVFNFDKADLPAVIRQLTRWYDLDVRFRGPIPVREFRGKLPRDLNLSQVLKILTEMDIKYRVEGHQLLIE